MKAYNCTYNTAHTEGYKKLAKPCVKKEIERLKEIKRQQVICSEEDIVDLHMRIAYADMGDYADIKNNTLKFRDSQYTDTSLIKEIKQGKDGISIKLEDKKHSLDFLERYFAKNKGTDSNIDKNMQALADIVLHSRENRRIEELEAAADESDSTVE